MGAIDFSINEELLRICARETGALRFVETGTFQGDSLAVALRHFDECWSVELSSALYAAAVERFAGESRARLHLGGSPAFLAMHREHFAAEPTVFWLDAHWCAADDTAGEDSQSPLVAELDALGWLHPDSVVLIDDARLYLSPPPAPHRLGDWPDFQDLLDRFREIGPEHRVMVLNDVIVLHPARLRDAIHRHATAHGVDWLTIANRARDVDRRRARRRWPFIRRRPR